MFGDIFDFDSPLAPLGSAIDSAIANQGQGQQPTPESTIRQGTIPGGDPDPNAPPAAITAPGSGGTTSLGTGKWATDSYNMPHLMRSIRSTSRVLVVNVDPIHHCLKLNDLCNPMKGQGLSLDEIIQTARQDAVDVNSACVSMTNDKYRRTSLKGQGH